MSKGKPGKEAVVTFSVERGHSGFGGKGEGSEAARGDEGTWGLMGQGA
jgi:hypothetical protein